MIDRQSKLVLRGFVGTVQYHAVESIIHEMKKSYDEQKVVKDSEFQTVCNLAAMQGRQEALDALLSQLVMISQEVV